MVLLVIYVHRCVILDYSYVLECSMRIENIDWQITSRCNRMCPYCFGPTNMEELPLSEAKRVVDILECIGAKQIGITGGEPLLYPYITELIEYIFDKGICIYLSTNCDYYGEFAQVIKDKISILGVPLDGALPAIHDSIRGSGSFQNVLHTISDICQSSCNTQIKVGTVLINSNLHDVENIERLIAPYQNKIIFWKIYELIIYSKNSVTALPIKTDYSFDRCNLGKHIGRERIIFDTLKERDRIYFFLKPNGDVFLPCLNQDYSIEMELGNIFQDDISKVINSFGELVNHSGYSKVFRFMKNSIER